jgi:Flp pilus assembly protein TadG
VKIKYQTHFATIFVKKTENGVAAPRLRNGHNLYSEADGQALVEVAVTLPVLLLLITGIFTFGVYINNNMELTNAVSNGARVLSVSRGLTTDPCATTASAVSSSAPTLNLSQMNFSFVLNGVSYTGQSCSSSSTSSGAAGNLVQGQPVTVTVTYPCSLAVYGHNYSPTCSLTTKTTELTQ